MTYLPTPDHKPELSRLDNMVIGLTRVVVLLYGAIAEIAAASDNPKLRQDLNKTTEEISLRLDEVIVELTRKDRT